MKVRCFSLLRLMHAGFAAPLLLFASLAGLGALPAAAAGLRVVTTLDDGDPVYGAVRYLADLSKQSTNQPGSVQRSEGGSDRERTASALASLRSGGADVAVVPLADIADKPIFSYSLQPFLSPDIEAARRLDLRMRYDIDRILDSDLKLALLGTLPQMPRVLVGPFPAWDGYLPSQRIFTMTAAETAGFRRIGVNSIDEAGAEGVDKLPANYPGFAIVPLPMAEGLASSGMRYVYDVRLSYPVMAMVTTKDTRARLDDTSNLTLSDMATAIEQAAWERVDRVAEGVLARIREKGRIGTLTDKASENLGNLFLASLEANAKNSVSEVVAYNSQGALNKINASGDRQVYGKKCRIIDILLVTNRALPPNALPGNVGPLPRRGKEWLATNDAQPHYGVVTLQVHAFSSDPPPTQVDCQDVAGRRSTPREEVLGVRLVTKAEFENLAAGQPAAFDAKAPFMLFVHGFNVNFGDAVQSIGRLSMQMKHALRPVLFSWPSAGSMWAYGDDGKMAAASPAALTETIETLAKVKPVRRVNLIAHSMGNRVMLDAMDTLRQAARRPAPGILDELISIAPDVQCDRYSAIAGQLQGDADPAKHSFRRATLYLYEKDSALKASKVWWALRDHTEKCRMGSRKGREAAALRGMEVVDWSCINEIVDSHSYYIGNDYIALDLRNVIQNHKAPKDRDLEPIDVPPDQYFLHLSRVNHQCAGVP